MPQCEAKTWRGVSPQEFGATAAVGSAPSRAAATASASRSQSPVASPPNLAVWARWCSDPSPQESAQATSSGLEAQRERIRRRRWEAEEEAPVPHPPPPGRRRCGLYPSVTCRMRQCRSEDDRLEHLG